MSVEVLSVAHEQSVQPCFSANFLPEGTFFAGEYTHDRIAAMRFAFQRGREFNADEEVRLKIIELYRTQEYSQLQIAALLDPSLSELYPAQAEVAVGYVVRKHIPEEERLRIQSKRSRDNLGRALGGYGSEQHRQHQGKASRMRHEKGIPVDTDAMTRGRGFTPWLMEEKALVLEIMLEDQGYLSDGRPNFNLIAESLNNMYHNDLPVWTAKKVYDMVRYEQRGKDRGEK